MQTVHIVGGHQGTEKNIIKSKQNNQDNNESDNKESGCGIRCLTVSPDGLHLATGDRNGHVRVHDLSTLNEIQSMHQHSAEVLSVAYSPVPPPIGQLNTSIGAISSGGKSHVEILSETNVATCSLLVSAGRDNVVNVHDGREKYHLTNTLKDHSASVTAVRFALDGSRLCYLTCKTATSYKHCN